MESREKNRQEKRAKIADQSYSQKQSGNWANKWQKKENWGNAQSAANAPVTKPPAGQRTQDFQYRQGPRMQGHIQRDFPITKGNVGGAKSQANSSAPPLPQKGATSAAGNGRNRLYALTNLQEAEASPDVVIGGCTEIVW
ncbi:uncharacterized protein LOC124896563 [Capsicum annuum]|uniref:uncharacterized protein LOC124896563 n=1 Tax=Capsicum annuum TaxID=4072 RepID=UPI001FB11A6A|nr:uncharacterized protein LOC124896563 [Capsicum annuum]